MIKKKICLLCFVFAFSLLSIGHSSEQQSSFSKKYSYFCVKKESKRRDLKHLHLSPLKNNPYLDAVYELEDGILYLDFKKNLGDANINITEEAGHSIYNEDLTIFDGLVKNFQFISESKGAFHIIITTEDGLVLQSELYVN